MCDYNILYSTSHHVITPVNFLVYCFVPSFRNKCCVCNKWLLEIYMYDPMLPMLVSFL